MSVASVATTSITNIISTSVNPRGRGLTVRGLAGMGPNNRRPAAAWREVQPDPRGERRSGKSRGAAELQPVPARADLHPAEEHRQRRLALRHEELRAAGPAHAADAERRRQADRADGK